MNIYERCWYRGRTTFWGLLEKIVICGAGGRSSLEGKMNVLKHHGIIAGAMGRTGKDTNIFIGNSGHTVLATHGGFVELLVKLNDKVKVGQKVAIQRNTFGEVVAEYTSGVDGEVTARRSDATAEPGILLITILYNDATHEFPVDYSE